MIIFHPMHFRACYIKKHQHSRSAILQMLEDTDAYLLKLYKLNKRFYTTHFDDRPTSLYYRR